MEIACENKIYYRIFPLRTSLLLSQNIFHYAYFKCNKLVEWLHRRGEYFTTYVSSRYAMSLNATVVTFNLFVLIQSINSERLQLMSFKIIMSCLQYNIIQMVVLDFT